MMEYRVERFKEEGVPSPQAYSTAGYLLGPQASSPAASIQAAKQNLGK
jgi:hypothetical protein